MAVVWSAFLAGTVVSGCVSDEPESLTLPAVHVGDQAEYWDEESGTTYRLTLESPSRVMTNDLEVVDAVSLQIDGAEVDKLFPQGLIFHHVGPEPAVGYESPTFDGSLRYHSIRDAHVPLSSLALLPFHGLAGETLRLGTSVRIAPEWLGPDLGENPCVLRVDRLYGVAGETQAEATCSIAGWDVLFVFSEESAFPLRVQTPRHDLVLDSHSPSGGPAVSSREASSPMEFSSVPYGEDGPEGGDPDESSLAAATTEVREGFPARKARECLEERPESVLRDASMMVYADGPHWRLDWSSRDGACEARVSAGLLDYVGSRDKVTPAPGLEYETPSEALGLSDAFDLWDRQMDGEIFVFMLELDRDGKLSYDIRDEAGTTMVLDAGKMELEYLHWPPP